MGRYDYTTLGQTAPDSLGNTVRVEGLHHPANRDAALPAQYEVVIEGRAQLDATDDDDRAKIEKLIETLHTALAHGQAVSLVDQPADADGVEILTPARVRFVVTFGHGAAMTVEDNEIQADR